jgi:hypothetical protein
MCLLYHLQVHFHDLISEHELKYGPLSHYHPSVKAEERAGIKDGTDFHAHWDSRPEDLMLYSKVSNTLLQLLCYIMYLAHYMNTILTLYVIVLNPLLYHIPHALLQDYATHRRRAGEAQWGESCRYVQNPTLIVSFKHIHIFAYNKCVFYMPYHISFYAALEKLNGESHAELALEQ